MITRKYIKQIKSYFDKMGGAEKGFVTIEGKFIDFWIIFEDYMEYAKGIPCLKDISNTLFSSLDKNKIGIITFKDLIQSMIKGIK